MSRSYYTLYLADGCPYCESAMQLISSETREYYARYYDWEDAALVEAKKRYNHSTVPIISKFTVTDDDEVEETFIGGYTELVEHLESEAQCQEESE